jgi:hypothetical protein
MTGEAKSRGTKEERVEAAVDRDEKIDKAVEDRDHTAGLVWMTIEVATSVPVLDGNKAFVLDERGCMRYGPDKWRPLLPADIPEWIKAPEVINELKGGVEVCIAPESGGNWYRGVVNTGPEDTETRH